MPPELQAIILGSIQGLGEFLPISSSGHLILSRVALNVHDQGLSFDVALHFGTLIAVLWYFRDSGYKELKKIWDEFRNGAKNAGGGNVRILKCVILATIPGALAGYLFEDWAESIFRKPESVAIMLASYALLLAAADRWNRNHQGKSVLINNISYGQAFLIGLAQALAIIPGTSRSGATITAGLFLGLSRKEAAVFSFILSVPIIMGATLSSAKDLLVFNPIDASVLLAGIFSAAIVGFLSIKYMLQYLTKHNYNLFVWYRIVLAAVIFILLR